jgi:hypothetical protein
MISLGDMREWGQDEVRIYTSRGWVLCTKRKEFIKGKFSNEIQEELNDIESSLPRNASSHSTKQSKVAYL